MIDKIDGAIALVFSAPHRDGWLHAPRRRAKGVLHQIKSQCTPSKERRITHWEHEHLVEEVQRRLDSNPDAMRTRREMVEHPSARSKPAPPDAVIDIAKARIEASHQRRRRSVLDTRAEHDRLIEALKAYGRPVICAFEATGNYHRPMAWRLIEAGFDVRLVWRLAGREN